DRSIQTFLPGAIDHTLSAAADFLQQLVVTKFHLHRRSAQFRRFIIVTVQERPQTSLKQAEAAKSLGRIREDPAPTFTANAAHVCVSTFRVITHLHGTVPNLVRGYVCSIAMKCRNSSSTSPGTATVCAISSRNNNRYRWRRRWNACFTAFSFIPNSCPIFACDGRFGSSLSICFSCSNNALLSATRYSSSNRASTCSSSVRAHRRS